MVNNAIILLSGGLDSVTTLFYVKNNIRPDKIITIFFDYNQRPIKEELYCAKKVTKKLKIPLKVVKLPWLGKLSTALINKNQDYPKTSMEDLKSIWPLVILSFFIHSQGLAQILTLVIALISVNILLFVLIIAVRIFLLKRRQKIEFVS